MSSVKALTVSVRDRGYDFFWSQEERAIVPKRQHPKVPTDGERVERRRQPRDQQAPADWEQIVLQRMAGRIKSLASDAARGATGAADGGWESAVLHRLQRRVQELDSKK